MLLVVAFGTLVAGGVLSELSASGAPSSTATVIVRWVIVASLVGAAGTYVVGGRKMPPQRG